MRFREVTGSEWVNRLVEFDRSIDPAWVCDVMARRPSNVPELHARAMETWLKRDRTTVVVATDGDELVGFIVVDDDRPEHPGSRGGCRGRWVAVDHRAPEILRGFFDYCSDIYGWIWGRLTNPLLQKAAQSFGCRSLPDDPNVFTYRRPRDG